MWTVKWVPSVLMNLVSKFQTFFLYNIEAGEWEGKKGSRRCVVVFFVGTRQF